VIRVDSLTQVFQAPGSDDVRALESVSFDVSDNEFIALVGPSGCGKSTLLRIVSGLVSPTAGQVTVDGKVVDGPKQDVGIVFQAPVLLGWRTVLDNVLFPVELLGLDRKKHRQDALELIQLVGLRGFEDKHPRQLSGGMQQRVSICRALIHDPSMLLMDEPFGALDALTREEMSHELLRIWEQRRKTILFVTHSIPEAVLLADRVIVMSARPGRVELDLAIRIDRPRRNDVERGAQFLEYCDQIRQVIFGAKR
jgi:NitT/TauT family transport system ATP-binding protein